MKKLPGIYMIENTANGKKYIGQSQNVKRRVFVHKNHLEQGISHNSHLQASYNKYGADAFIFSVVEYCPVEDLDSREQFWIKHYDSFRNGYNQTLGGGGNRGYTVSEETKEKIRNNRRDMSGEHNPMYGKSWKDSLTEDEIANHNKRISDRLRELSPSSKSVICLNTGEVYKNATEASVAMDILQSSISRCCREKLYNGLGANKYVFAYYDDYCNMNDSDIKRAIREGGKKNKPSDSKHAKRIVNITTGEVFGSVKEASSICNIRQSTISSTLSSKGYSVAGMTGGRKNVWMEYKDYYNLSCNDIYLLIRRADTARSGANSHNATPVACLNNGRIFETLTAASNFYHVSTANIWSCCNGRTTYAGTINGEKLHWAYVS